MPTDPLAISFRGTEGSGGAQILPVYQDKALAAQNSRLNRDLERAKIAKSQAIKSGQKNINFKLEGWDIDKQRELSGHYKNYRQLGIEMLKKGVQHNDPISGGEDYYKMQQLRENMSSLSDASIQHEAVYSDALKQLTANPKKYNFEQSKKNLATFRNLSIQERMKMDQALLVPVPEERLDPIAFLNKHRQILQRPEKEGSSWMDDDGNIHHKKTEILTPEAAGEELSRVYDGSEKFRKEMQVEFSELTEQQQKTQGNPKNYAINQYGPMLEVDNIDKTISRGPRGGKIKDDQVLARFDLVDAMQKGQEVKKLIGATSPSGKKIESASFVNGVLDYQDSEGKKYKIDVKSQDGGWNEINNLLNTLPGETRVHEDEIKKYTDTHGEFVSSRTDPTPQLVDAEEGSLLKTQTNQIRKGLEGAKKVLSAIPKVRNIKWDDDVLSFVHDGQRYEFETEDADGDVEDAYKKIQSFLLSVNNEDGKYFKAGAAPGDIHPDDAKYLNR